MLLPLRKFFVFEQRLHNFIFKIFYSDGNYIVTIGHASKLLVELDWIKGRFVNENPEFFVEFMVGMFKLSHGIFYNANILLSGADKTFE